MSNPEQEIARNEPFRPEASVEAWEMVKRDLNDIDPDVDLDAYEPNDPKRMALDPGFDVDFMRDQWRGK